MQYLATAAIALAAVAPVAHAGNLIVQNNCPFDLNVKESSADFHDKNSQLASHKLMTVPIQSVSNGGISMKFSRSNDFTNSIAQFEYTLNNKLWYDFSLVNGQQNPFEGYGVTIVPQDTKCASVVCMAGAGSCEQAYMQPNNDYATNACSNTGTDVAMVLCSGQDNAQKPSSNVLDAIKGLFGGSGFQLGDNSGSSQAPAPAAPVAAAPAASAAPAAAAPSQAQAQPQLVSQANVAPPAAVTSVVAKPAQQGDVVVTTLVTVVATQVAQAVAEPSAKADDGKGWFGHIPEAHGPQWNAVQKKRHVHHMHQRAADDSAVVA